MFMGLFCYFCRWIAHNRWWPTTFGSWSISHEDTLGICQKPVASQTHLVGWGTRFSKITSLGPKRVHLEQGSAAFRTCQWQIRKPGSVRGQTREGAVRRHMSGVVLFFPLTSVMRTASELDSCKSASLEISLEGRSLQFPLFPRHWGILSHRGDQWRRVRGPWPKH